MQKIENHISAFFSKLDSYPFYVAYVLFLLNLCLKFYNISYGSFDLDEAWHAFYGQNTFIDLLKKAGEDPNPPLYNLLVGWWMKIFGASEIGIRSFVVLCSSLTAPALFLFARKNFGVQAALTAAFIFTFSTVQYYYSHDARVYALLCLILVASFYFFFELLKNTNPKTFTYFIIANVLLIYTHTTAIYIFAVQFFITLLYLRSQFKKVFLINLSLAAPILAFVPWVYFSPYYNKPKPTSWELPPDFEKVKAFLIDYLNTPTLLIVFLLLLFLSFAFLKKHDGAYLKTAFWALLFWAFIPIVINFIISHAIVPIFGRRYMVYTTVGMYLLFANCIWLLPIKQLYRTVISCIVIGLFINSIQLKTFKGEDWRGAVNYIKQYKNPTSLVFVSPYFQYATFAFYYDTGIYKDYKAALKQLEANNVFMVDNPDFFKNESIDRFQEIIVLTSQESIVNPGSLIEYMNTHFSLIDQKDFLGVSTRIYSKDSGKKIISTHTVDFDLTCIDKNTSVVPISNAHSGTMASLVNSDNQYGSGFHVYFKEIPADATYASVSVWFNAINKSPDATLIVASQTGDSLLSYATKKIQNNVPGTWQQIELKSMLPGKAIKNGEFKAYVMNSGNDSIFIDDFKIDFVK